MHFYTIYLKRHPHLFVGKKRSFYAIKCPEDIEARIANYNNQRVPVIIARGYPVLVGNELIDDIICINAHWFVPNDKAKVWTNLSSIKRFLSYCGMSPVKTDLSKVEYMVMVDGSKSLEISELYLFQSNP
jgi:hypothetical protein